MKKLLGILVFIIALFAIATVSVSAETVENYIVGDVDMDGVVSVKDATLTQTYVSKLGKLTDEQIKIADCDDKAGVQITDATIMQIYVAKMKMDYPKNADGYKIGEKVTLKESVLKNGVDCCNLFRTFPTNATAIIFDYKSNYNDVEFSKTTNIDVDNLGEITLNVSQDGKTAYVLSDNIIKANPDSAHMFYYLPNIETIEFKNLDTSDVTTMYNMFANSTSIKSLDLSVFDTSNVVKMNYMFDKCESITTLNLSSFDTSNVKDMSGMFRGLTVLKEIDVTNFKTQNVKYFYDMFAGCGGLTKIDVSNFNTSNAVDMAFMFSDCSNITELDLSSFDTSNVSNMTYMFRNCYDLKTIFASDSFVTDNVTESQYMFYYCTNLVGGNGTSYKSLSVSDKTYACIDTPTQKGYFTKKA